MGDAMRLPHESLRIIHRSSQDQENRRILPVPDSLTVSKARKSEG